MKATKTFGPINEKLPHLIHGADYNPDQWLDDPAILDEDLRLMKLAGVNAATVGIFSWAAIEPREGVFEFGWLDRVLDRLAENGLFAVLATPSGARPAWLSQTHPEVLRVGAHRVRILHGGRHNHCYTSPVYREKVRGIDERLSERYAKHPALIAWHISNEYGGECHCGLCQEAFRRWLKARYHDSLEELNRAWWTSFWSHIVSDWLQIESPAPHGENAVHGLNLDWKRFVTSQTADFLRGEVDAIRRFSRDVPVTTNFMGTYPGLDYWRLAPDLDRISWDSYPSWHGHGPKTSPRDRWHESGTDYRLAADVAFLHDLNRSLGGGRPFMLMESTPSVTNWQSVAKLKRPGVHILSSLQAVAHGSDTVQYFQWRKSRGSSEKFHGAVVDHVGHEHTRVFREVAELGALLPRLDDVIGSVVPAEVAVIYDWENRWAIEDAQGPRNDGLTDYEATCKSHYYPLWALGVSADVVSMEADLSPYRLVIAPMLYMVRAGVAERIESFVRSGGVFVATYLSGYADENDLCFLGGVPGPLRELLGIWSEEVDALYAGESNRLEITSERSRGLSGSYSTAIFSELVHAEGAEVLGVYRDDFYAGMPALTVNEFGAGQAYYVASRNEDTFLMDLTRGLVRSLSIERALEADLPQGVSVARRVKNDREFLFIQNFTPEAQHIDCPGVRVHDLLDDSELSDAIALAPWGVRVVEKR